MITGLHCFLCGRAYSADEVNTVCDCGRPLRVDYELGPKTLDRHALIHRPPTMWRYREVLPECEPVTLGEGMTPLMHAPSLGPRWFIKDEALNPTASFKSRGMSAAVSMAKKFGITKLAVPSAGNAGSALAAYSAKVGIAAHLFMPKDTPRAFAIECEAFGAEVTPVDGLITDCAAELKKRLPDVFDLSTLKEPYRVEGKKTMGYELAEQLDWRLPDAIIYPAGGGTGLIGMWKAFDEMQQMGWVGAERPKMIAVQAAGCAPIARAFEKGERFAEEFANAHTKAAGLRVPRAIGDFIMLDAIRESHGTAITVTDDEMINAANEMSRKTGIFACPEGGATLAAAQKLRESKFLKDSDIAVLFNTCSGLKYTDVFAR